MSSTSSAPSKENAASPVQGQDENLHFVVRKGLDLPITGQVDLSREETRTVRQVALLGPDYIGLKPTMAVAVGDRVKRGQLLFTDKKTPGLHFTSPASGTVSAINRGAKRALQSVVIAVDGDEEESFPSYSETQLEELSPELVRDGLLASGLWTALRTRPYGKIPSPESSPHALFVNAMDTNPLAAPPRLALQGREDDFRHGLRVLAHLTTGPLYLCQDTGESLPGTELPMVTPASFAGPHPAGLPGTHIHFLDPVSANKSVWHLALQDVLAIGTLFTTGRLDVTRLIALGGSCFTHPHLLRAPLGANIADLVANELPEMEPEEVRIISGSVLFGHLARGPLAYLGRHHLQISAIQEDSNRLFLDWHRPGLDRFSTKNTFISRLIPGKRFSFTTSTGGGIRPMVPIGMFEKVMPMDFLITPLLRALMVGDTDQAQALGCLELDEEDLALCTFVCPGKDDYCAILRSNLNTIEIEG